MADGASNQGSWIVQLQHKNYPDATVDLTEFAEGASDESKAPNWGGAFTGRPKLLGDLFIALKVSFHGLTPKRAFLTLSVLRSFWRHLDAKERYFEEQGISYQKVCRLHHITGTIFDAFLHPGPNGAWEAGSLHYGRMLRPIIDAALRDAGISPIRTNPIPSRHSVPKDTASDEEGLSLIRFLRDRTMDIFRRWQHADALAERGRDLGEMHRELGAHKLAAVGTTEADAHATYRAFVARSRIAAPKADNFWRHLGYARSYSGLAWWPRVGNKAVAWSDLEGGLHPTSADVATLALLCIGRLAWNPSTLLGMDVQNWHAPYDDQHTWVFSPKARANGSYQHGVSKTKQPSGVYSTIQRFIERSQTLRNWVRDDPTLHPTPSIFLRSPFIGLNLRRGMRPFVADPEGDPTLNNWLRKCIRDHNKVSGSIQVRDMTPSDFRDIAAAVMFRDSRYSMWFTQLLLGHVNQSSTIRYGFRHSSRQESHRQVSMVVQDALDQARDTGQIDPTLIRARIEGIEVSSDARARLDKYRLARTYAGAVCGTPTDPPKDIDPSHPRDGRTRCAQGHVCVARACPRALVLQDSLDAICRSVAELEWRRDRLPAVRWSNSSAAADLDTLVKVLRQWPAAEVETHLGRWREQLATGQHRPLYFGGTHG